MSYSTSPTGFAPHKAGSHLRHILEFYECFLDGLPLGRVDYDSRKRDLTVEASRAAATARIEQLLKRLAAVSAIDAPLLIHPEDADSLDAGGVLLRSSVSRELMSLSSHTIHHFALIAMTLQAHGVRLDPRFGMAPSTLRYQQRQSLSEAA